MTVLVTGASGFVGGRVVAALVGRGDRVVAPVSSAGAARRVAGIAPDEVVSPVIDPGDRDALRTAAAGCRQVVHLAGVGHGAPAGRARARGANRLPGRDPRRGRLRAPGDGTGDLLAALPADARRLLFVSSVAVYGFERPWPVDVSTPADPWTPRGFREVQEEALVRAWRDGEAVIARPTIVYGPGVFGPGVFGPGVSGPGEVGGFVPWLWRLLHHQAARRLPLPGDGANRVDLLHVDDLVRGLLAALDAGSGTYVLGGPAPATASEVATGIAAAAGLAAPVFGTPARVARAAGSAMELLWRSGLPGRPPWTAHDVDLLTRDRAYNRSRAAEGLSWRPDKDLASGLAETLDWLTTRQGGPQVTGDQTQTTPRGRRSSA